MGLFLLSDLLQENTACDTLIDVTHLGGKRQEVDEGDAPVAFALASGGARPVAVAPFSFAAAPAPPPGAFALEAAESADDQPAQVLV